MCADGDGSHGDDNEGDHNKVNGSMLDSISLPGQPEPIPTPPPGFDLVIRKECSKPVGFFYLWTLLDNREPTWYLGVVTGKLKPNRRVGFTHDARFMANVAFERAVRSVQLSAK
eukprot:6212606-Pleurochrysis_carterae.AAC.1